MEHEKYAPRVMYHPDGASRRVNSAQLETALTAQGWALTSFPPVEPEERLDVEGQLDKLRTDVLNRLDALEGLIKERKPNASAESLKPEKKGT